MPLASINGIRMSLYIALWLFAAVLLGLTAARLHYTTHLPPWDPLNHGHPFYDPIVAELLASAVLALLWASFAIHVLCPGRTHEYGLASCFAAELAALFVLFLLWLVGAAISSTYWGALGWCHVYAPCRVLSALVACAWVGWAALLGLLALAALLAGTNRALRWQMHGRYDPRASGAGAGVGVGWGRTVRA
ncbi:hypothetical protein AcV7_010002 [Taiwanofungus camphoratus]|nr:hypothetical protein AcV7_010002 [Antrodia cinnamomea]